MPGVRRFEDLRAWQAASELVVAVYGLTRRGAFARFLGYAPRSAVEAQALLHAARLVGYITPEEFETVYHLAGKAKGLTD